MHPVCLVIGAGAGIGGTSSRAKEDESIQSGET